MAKRNPAAGKAPAKTKTNSEAEAAGKAAALSQATGAATPESGASPAALEAARAAAAGTDAPRAQPEAGADGKVAVTTDGPASTNSNDAPAAPKTRAVLVVKARQASRRRAGFDFTKQERVLNAADLSADEIAAIEADPMLTVKRDERPVE
jgi:hypothetical protein